MDIRNRDESFGEGLRRAHDDIVGLVGSLPITLIDDHERPIVVGNDGEAFPFVRSEDLDLTQRGRGDARKEADCGEEAG